jgi:hypothetical protein
MRFRSHIGDEQPFFRAARTLYPASSAAFAPSIPAIFRRKSFMKTLLRLILVSAIVPLYSSLLVPCGYGQETPGASDQAAPGYVPKFKGDPARSDSEAAALAYMRVVIRAQNQFNKHYSHYATSLPELVHSGSFTKRMVDPNRGDYTVSFKGKKDGYVLTMTPRNMDAQHRSFYAEEDGKIHADDSKPADDQSPVVK